MPDVIEYGETFIKMWSFKEGDAEVENARSSNPDPSTWRQPTFNTLGSTSGSSCNVAKYYGNQKIVINLDFCGTAGDLNAGFWGNTATYQWEKQGMSCTDYVGGYPADFQDYYFLVNNVKVSIFWTKSSNQPKTSSLNGSCGHCRQFPRPIASIKCTASKRSMFY